MIPQAAVQGVKEFIANHSDELKHSPVAKTALFCDYIVYCNEHGYRQHTNLVQFCREIIVETIDNSRIRTRKQCN
jgi:hypothetical protein